MPLGATQQGGLVPPSFLSDTTMAKTGFVAIAPTMDTADSPAIETGQWDKLTVLATGLGPADNITIIILAGDSSIPYTDTAQNQIVLDASTPMYVFPGGPTYVFQKTDTVADVGVYYYPQPD